MSVIALIITPAVRFYLSNHQDKTERSPLAIDIWDEGEGRTPEDRHFCRTWWGVTRVRGESA